MSADTSTSRERILRAAAELAKEVGPGNLSLEAIAARAGLSKGGLLYNFPSKTKLLEAVVQSYLDDFDAALRQTEQHEDSSNPTARAFLGIFLEDYARNERPPAGILAALAEGLSFLDPVRRYNRDLLDRMKGDSGGCDAALVVFLAVEGMRAMKLFDADVLTDDERAAVVDRLRRLIEGE